MLVECYARHDPLNPTAILGLERYSASFAEMTSEKFVSRENAVQITDLSGTATYLGKKDFKGPKALPLGWAGMETERAGVLRPRPGHACATLQVTKYMGFEATHEREFLFVKNRFVLVRDETDVRRGVPRRGRPGVEHPARRPAARRALAEHLVHRAPLPGRDACTTCRRGTC